MNWSRNTSLCFMPWCSRTPQDWKSSSSKEEQHDNAQPLSATPQVIRFRSARFEYTVQRIPVKFLYMANTLFWTPLEIEVTNCRIKIQTLSVLKWRSNASLDGLHKRKFQLVYWFHIGRPGIIARFTTFIQLSHCGASFSMWEKKNDVRGIKKLNIAACEQILLFGDLM